MAAHLIIILHLYHQVAWFRKLLTSFGVERSQAAFLPQMLSIVMEPIPNR